VEFLLDDKFTTTFSILIGLGILFQLTLQNFIYKDIKDLENVQRNKEKEKR
jgi:hypothetical protein